MPDSAYHHESENPPPHSHHDDTLLSEQQITDYWRANLRLLAQLLTVWFMVSFGCGIVLVDWLDQFSLFGFKLGFWFAQQGAIYVFVALIFIYAWRIHAIERAFGVDDDDFFDDSHSGGNETDIDTNTGGSADSKGVQR
jgi:putative solute:sodium symporter small subunit